jgi:hypothetical protein
MAVAETSRSSGKSSASGATRSTRSQRARGPRRTEFQASNRHVAPVPIAQAAINSIAIATVQASKLLAEQNITLAAQRNTYLVADTRLSSTAVGSELVAGNKIEVAIGNAALLSGAQLSAQDIAFTRTPATGENARAPAQLILDGAANTLQVSRTEKGDTLGLWQSATGAGKTEQTLTQTSLKGSTSFDPTLKISVTLPAGELKTQLATLSAQPGMDYLAQLAKRDDVNWQGVKLAHDKWDYFAPFGNVVRIPKLLESVLCKVSARYLYHRSNERGVRVLTSNGANVDPAYARQWWSERPMLASSSTV